MTAMDIEALVARAMLGLAPQVVVDETLPADAARYEGIYAAGGRQTRVAREGDRMMVSSVGSESPPEAMQYQGAHEFVPYREFPGYRFIFATGGDRARAFSTYDAGWFAGARVRVAAKPGP